MIDLLIRDGTIVSPVGTFKGSIGVKDQKIVSVCSNAEVMNANKTINAEGKYVLPGIIDPHVHLMGAALGKTFKENCRNESPSMVFGGVTSVLGFVSDAKSYMLALPDIIKEIQANSLVNVGFHAVINNPQQVNEIKQCGEKLGVMSFKFFIAGGGRELYPGSFTIDDGQFLKALGIIASLGYPATAMVHAENHEIAATLKEQLIAEGRKDQKAWLDSRPNFCEEEPIRRAIFLAGLRGCPLYVVHVSIANGPSLIAEARAKGQRVMGEAVIHYLTFTIDDKFDVMGKSNPPLRRAEDREALWVGIKNGSISFVGSDHIPNRSKATLNVPGGDVWTAKGPYPGSGLVLPVMLNEGVNKRGVSLERVVEVCCLNPAKYFGLYPRKGTLIPGADADIVVVDMKRTFTATPESLHLSSDFTWYNGRTFQGWPSHTIVNGKVIVEDGEIIEKPGYASYLSLKQLALGWPCIT